MSPFRKPSPKKCTLCRESVIWPTKGQVFQFRDGDYVQITLDGLGDRASRADRMASLYRRCPDPRGRGHHYLPATYFDWGDPLVVGLVGGSGAGKTHLLASMVGVLLRDGESFGLTVDLMDPRWHDRFRRGYLDPLFGAEDPDQSVQLPGTGTGSWEPIEILLLRGPGREPRPVAFFDAAGGDLRAAADVRGPATGASAERVGGFLAGVDALLFVAPVGDPPEPTPERSVISQAISRVRSNEGFREIPAVVAISKADRVRYEPVVDRWLRQPSSAPLDRDALWRESRDAYAYLHEQGHVAATTVYEEFRRCTLHFTSATGREARGGRYARGVAPMRVVEPLLALFAMAGILPDGAEVGT